MLYLNYLQLFLIKYKQAFTFNRTIMLKYEITHGFKPFIDVQKCKWYLTKKVYYIMRTHLLKIGTRCPLCLFSKEKKFFSVSRKV